MNTELAIQRDPLAIAQLPDAEKDRLELRLAILSAALTDPKPVRRLREECERVAHVDGMKFHTLRKMMYAIRDGGDWRVCLDQRRQRGAKPQTSEFVEYWRELCQQNQRKCKPAHRKLIRDFQAGEFIPGVGTWVTAWRREHPGKNPPSKCPANFIPRGWDYRTLMKKAPSSFELTAVRQGRKAAVAFRPQVLSTRVGLKFGERYVFDDVEHDVLVNFLDANSKGMRPLELGCQEVLSAARVAWGCRPTILNDLTNRKEKIKEAEMRYLLAKVLTEVGFRDDDTGTVLMVESGTATVREDLEKRLVELTAGKVTVDRAPCRGDAAFAGLFEGRGKGNPRFKACLESAHNLIHNETAALPGNVGKDRDHAPEELFGRDKYNTQLIRAMAMLPAEQIQRLRFPELEFDEFMMALGTIYDRIDARTDHKLEGWKRCGFYRREFRMGCHFPWQDESDLLALPEPQQSVARAMIEQQDDLRRIRRMSPLEVSHAHRHELTRLSPHLVPMILGRELAVERKVRDGLIEFEDHTLSSEPLIYYAQVKTPAGYIERLPDGPVLTYINPFDPGRLFVAGARNDYIGFAASMNIPCKSDVEALKRELGRARKEETALLAPLARRGARQTRERIKMHQANTVALKGGDAALGHTSRSLDRQQQSRERSANKAIEAAFASNNHSDE